MKSNKRNPSSKQLKKKRSRSPEKQLKKEKIKDGRRTSGRKGNSIKEPVYASGRQFWQQNWIAAMLLTLLSFGLYYPSLTFDYVLDDAIVLSENRFVEQGFGGIKDIMSKDTFWGYALFEGKETNLVGSRYRPLSLVTFAIETAFQKVPEAVQVGVA